MKEITRIHLAKIAYDIELDAKKDIQKYIAALEQYADEPDLLADIEIRMTELLAERGVQAGGVIAKEDVLAVRERLGEPSDFAPEGMGDIALGKDELTGPERRVYRDVDGAVLGGVLSGVAKYIGIDPLWMRLIFIVVLIASFGTALVLYFILWLVIPPARTAAEKLRMVGQPVTLASIKQLSEQTEPVVNESARTVKTVLAIGTGILLTLMAIGALVAVVFGVFGVATLGNDAGSSLGYWQSASWWLYVAVGLFAVSGVLFAVLCTLLANALFRRRWTKRTGVAMVAIIVAGLVLFISGLGVRMYGRWQEQTVVNSSRSTSYVNLPGNFSAVKTVTIEADDSVPTSVQIEYIVSDRPRSELDALPGMKPQFEIADDSLSANIKLVRTDGKQTWQGWEYMASPVLRIYGPALERIESRGVAGTSYYNERAQAALTVASKGAGFDLAGGTYDAVTVANEDGGNVNLVRATIGSLTVHNKGGLVEAGVVRNLAVEQLDICPGTSVAAEPNAKVRVQAVSSGKLTFNTVERLAQTVSNECGTVQIGHEDFE